MTVKALVGDATRRMAHNNEDLYQRWLMRVEDRSLDQAERVMQEMFIPDVEYNTVQEAKDLKDALSEKKNFLDVKISDERLFSKERKDVPKFVAKREFEEWKQALGNTSQKLQHRITVIKRYIKKNETVDDRIEYLRAGLIESNSQYRMTAAALIEAQQTIIQLQKKVVQLGGAIE